MTASNKQRVVTKLSTMLAKLYSDELPKELSVLDHLLLGVIQEETAFSRALAAYRGLLAGFFDLNELRVSHPRELQDLFGGDIPDAESKAKRILDILRFVFETTYSFDLESMHRKPLKQAQKQLSKIAGATPFAVAATVQRSLSGHAMPVDRAMCEVLYRLEVIDETDPEVVRSAVEHLIPKSKGVSFCLLLSELSADASHREDLLRTLAPRSKRHPEPVSAKPPSNKQPPAAAEPKPRKSASKSAESKPAATKRSTKKK